ncbi:polysaccharide biosynthesis tyrosine autokinase [Massilia sp. YIM B02763]|uniref:polysaccharide biosynthesis tyrosine autokinase n=1 Tax=Massilia sp. YIM B02763 TaxID=3050130 RepID=UPI0025B63833|nr:polysaccharide biosynthesis tyrosine autokinase [Massilia sp. YIM B02763]MDN4056288.1 polysaccharide biosynthesis tyrosine autokinase [Massilia sp. YIM B02763]
MTMPGEPQSLTPVVPRPPLLSVPFDPRVVDGPQEEPAFDLKGYLNTLFDNRWLIGGITALITLVAVLYALVAKPVYEANLMIHVEEESPNASKNILSEASSLFETKKAAIAEMELLRSRMVVSRAVDNLRLCIDVRPKYFPIAGFWFANQNGGALSQPGLFGYGGYVWGGEKAEVPLFEVPEAWLGREFTLTALGKQRFRFSGGGQRIVFDGDVGLRYRVPVPEGTIELKVERMQANAGARFTLRRMSRVAMIQGIQNALMITEQGKQSGIIQVKLQGESARRTHSVLSEIGREYMRQNLARKTEEAEKSLAFLNQQLPVLKRQLEQAEDRYNQFRNRHGTVDLQEEARMSLAQAAAARTRRIELIQKKTELLARFTEDHPIMVAINRQRQEVDAEIAEINARIKSLPELEQDEARLTRDIKVNTDLYTALSNTAQQLRLISVGRVSNVRMVDAPIPPEKPIKPNRALIVALAVVTGLFLGTLLAFARKSLAGGIDDPYRIERLLRARVVYATIPHSSNQDKLMRKSRRDGILPLLARIMPEDPAVESLRSFRAALQFSMPHFRNNIVMFAGPTRGLGKSFVSANFAAVMAASGKRVLLIDADLRSGQLHRYFGVKRDRGLSSAIVKGSPAKDVIHHDVIENLDFIPTGELPSNRSEFLLHLNLGGLLQQVACGYDLVLVDPPPLLEVADALIIGAHAGAVFIVARSGRTNEAQINESIKRLNHAGVSPQGVLFNDMAPRLGAYGAHPRFGIAGQIGFSKG